MIFTRVLVELAPASFEKLRRSWAYRLKKIKDTISISKCHISTQCHTVWRTELLFFSLHDEENLILMGTRTKSLSSSSYNLIRSHSRPRSCCFPRPHHCLRSCHCNSPRQCSRPRSCRCLRLCSRHRITSRQCFSPRPCLSSPYWWSSKFSSSSQYSSPSSSMSLTSSLY